jgi:membrane-bound lytic murein transglycosylase B
LCTAPDSYAAKKHTKKKGTPPAASANAEPMHFSQWSEVADFIAQMADKHGFDRQQLTKTFDQLRYQDTPVQLVKPTPPGRTKNWRAYRARFVEPRRIEAGIAFWDQYEAALTRAENQYGVPAEIIVGLLGVETIFGRNTGSYRTMDVLTTLGFAYPDTPNRDARMRFFRSELESLLLLARDEHSDPLDYRGSYAGAIGWPQFMPSNIRQYAVDFDGDGKIDLTGSPVDAIGSVANYLSQHGWIKGLPTAFPATLDGEDAEGHVVEFQAPGLKASYTLEQLKRVATTASDDAPKNMLYGLVDLQNGDEATEYWFVTDNFYAITHYNRSYFYAMSVIDLGKVIGAARAK